MPNIEIRRWDNQEIIVCGEYESVKDCLKKNKDKSFYRADLRYADLRSADLRSADLSYANLSYANLRYADLRSANLRSANLRSADLSYADLRFADLSFADLRSADLSSADLSSADLRSADLRSADLRYANLRSVDLRSANLRSADLSYADLRFADLKEPICFVDLYYFLTLQPELKLRAWKYLKNGKSPYQSKEYEVGKEYIFDDLDKNKLELCGKGGNVATLNWCLKDDLQADEFLEVEFNTNDMIVPYFSDGKFRVSKFFVLRKINREQAIELIGKL